MTDMDRDPTEFEHDSGEAAEKTLTASRTIDEQAAAIEVTLRKLVYYYNWSTR